MKILAKKKIATFSKPIYSSKGYWTENFNYLSNWLFKKAALLIFRWKLSSLTKFLMAINHHMHIRQITWKIFRSFLCFTIIPYDHIFYIHQLTYMRGLKVHRKCASFFETHEWISTPATKVNLLFLSQLSANILTYLQLSLFTCKFHVHIKALS